VARGFGVHGEGPITDPKDLAPALKRAISGGQARRARADRRRHRSALRSLRHASYFLACLRAHQRLRYGGACPGTAPQGDATAGNSSISSTGLFYCHGRVGQGGAYNREAPSLAKTIVPYLGFKQQLRNPSGDMRLMPMR
jgi:hypothetical protein